MRVCGEMKKTDSPVVLFFLLEAHFGSRARAKATVFFFSRALSRQGRRRSAPLTATVETRYPRGLQEGFILQPLPSGERLRLLCFEGSPLGRTGARRIERETEARRAEARECDTRAGGGNIQRGLPHKTAGRGWT